MLNNDEFVLNEKRLKKIIKEVLDEYFDPDYGMEIKEEFAEILKKSKSEEGKGDTVSLEELEKEL